MNIDQLYQVAFLVGTWIVTGWVTLMVTKARLEAWMDRTKRLEDWKDETTKTLTDHEVRISVLEDRK